MAGFGERFAAYKASKKVLFWSWVGVAVLTMVVGFTWGGWVTGGAATKQAKTAAEDAVAQLAADVCYTRFMNAPDVQTSLTALKEEKSYARKSFVEKGGWVTIGGHDKPTAGAAEICADKLAEAELPVAAVTPVADAGATEPVAN
jgi:hypothetical protein